MTKDERFIECNNKPHDGGAEKSPCFAKLEFQTQRSEIEASLKRYGGNRLSAYWELFEAGLLTMAYRTFCDYVRSEGILPSTAIEPEPPDLIDEIDSLKELDFDGPAGDFGCDRRSIYHNLVGLGIIGFGYSDFCDYFGESDI